MKTGIGIGAVSALLLLAACDEMALPGLAPSAEAISPAESNVTIASSEVEPGASAAQTAAIAAAALDMAEARAQLASLEPAPAREPPTARRGGGLRLFGRAAPEDGDPQFAPDEPLPFGTLTRACGTSRRALGTEIAKSDAGFRLYDSNPATTAPRTQYVTGFKDGCPRRFTAALALFGSPAMHEAARYNPLNNSPFSETDAAYEKIKAQVCGVRQGAPCPADRAERLARDAAFVTVYRGFGDTRQRLEIFLHRGRLVTQALRDG